MTSFKTRLLVAASALMVAGCGTSPSTTGLEAASKGTVNAQASATLRQGFEDIHKAIFDMADRNKDGSVDEYEAGPYFNLRTEFPKADKGKAGMINYNEFMAYSTKGGFLSANDSPDKFLDRTRSFLQSAFGSLDKLPSRGWFDHGDGFLSSKEVTKKEVTKLGLGFSYPKLHLDIKMKSFLRADFKEADKTGDNKLSQGEFEDLYVKTVVTAITKLGGKPSTPPAPPNPPAPPATDSVNPGTSSRLGADGRPVMVIDTDAWQPWEDQL